MLRSSNFVWRTVSRYRKSRSIVMKTSYSLYSKDIHEISCRSAKFLWKSKFCSRSGSWFYSGFQYQTYISYIEDTHQILFRSANSFESYCLHMKSPRTCVQTDRRIDRRRGGQKDGQAEIFFWLVLSSKTHKSWTFVKRRDFFSLMRLQYFLFLHTSYVMRK